eukprot:TRINITY_DN2720_c0_g1_i8.p1 TRINITY_DN2720_c0_g1~~TRINITY_DN2720_c0_g1_i8.p1  ORF type:complete len:514 (+),score=118.06 TRINITY_DN2720_c0_g1_i8:110-1543(+)
MSDVVSKQALAFARQDDLIGSVERLAERLNKLEPRIEDAVKELNYAVEGAESRIKNMFPTLTATRRDLQDLQVETNNLASRLNSLSANMHNQSPSGQELARRIEEISDRIAHQDSRFLAFQHLIDSNRDSVQRALSERDKHMDELTNKFNRYEPSLQKHAQHMNELDVVLDNWRTVLATKAEKREIDGVLKKIEEFRVSLEDKASKTMLVENLALANRLAADTQDLQRRMKEVQGTNDAVRDDQKRLEDETHDLQKHVRACLEEIEELHSTVENVQTPARAKKSYVDEQIKRTNESIARLREELLGSLGSNNNSLAAKLSVRCLSCDHPLQARKTGTSPLLTNRLASPREKLSPLTDRHPVRPVVLDGTDGQVYRGRVSTPSPYLYPMQQSYPVQPDRIRPTRPSTAGARRKIDSPPLLRSLSPSSSSASTYDVSEKDDEDFGMASDRSGRRQPSRPRSAPPRRTYDTVIIPSVYKH